MKLAAHEGALAMKMLQLPSTFLPAGDLRDGRAPVLIPCANPMFGCRMHSIIRARGYRRVGNLLLCLDLGFDDERKNHKARNPPIAGYSR